MEFEDNKPVSDEDRRLAEAKKLTLQPLHTDISPETLTDSEIATRHVNEPAINNISSDTEQMVAQVMPTKSLLDAQAAARPQTYKLMAGIVSGAILFAGLAVFALLK